MNFYDNENKAGWEYQERCWGGAFRARKRNEKICWIVWLIFEFVFEDEFNGKTFQRELMESFQDELTELLQVLSF